MKSIISKVKYIKYTATKNKESFRESYFSANEIIRKNIIAISILPVVSAKKISDEDFAFVLEYFLNIQKDIAYIHIRKSNEIVHDTV